MKTKMKDDPEDIPWHTYGMSFSQSWRLWPLRLLWSFDCFRGLKVCDLTIRSITDCVDLGHVTLDVIFASVPRSISYPRIRMQSVHVVRIVLTPFRS